ncbi:glycoside hydrolase family 2 protein [Labilibacter marinus]|uniref:glycoside hydrolase family 2 protein n=1 Tax=Labilibacter marinus TaxID=1477105 RepID=UPI0008364BBA|nr:glycoside hydrolase family 2 [Labilibacter marinus]
MKFIYILIVALGIGFIGNAQTQQTSLNGAWDFFASNNKTEYEVLANYNIEWDKITVPGNWDTQDAYAEYIGKGYYQKEFKVSSSWKGKQIRIKFGAVYQTSKVWVNGKQLGVHFGGYTPFEYNITDVINFGKPNTVLVMADNSYKRGAWWAWGGISRDVTLTANDDVHLIYQHISAIPDFNSNKVRFVLKYKVENNACNTYKAKISSIINGHGFEKELSSKISITGKSIQTKEITFEEDLSHFQLWDFNHPHLYALTSELKAKGHMDSKTDKFGIRKLEVRGEQMFLNNAPVRMNGLNRVHDHPKYGNTEPDQLVKQDMLDIKSLGCNFARLMHAPLSENLLEFCDSIGFLLIEEIPVWGNDDPQSFPDNPLTKKWLKDMIERDFNHPSVVGWSVGNELRDSVPNWGKKLLTARQHDYVASMLDYIDELDTTRLKTFVSLTAYSEGANPSNEPVDKVDFICINSYGNSAKAVRDTHKKFPGIPIFLSEVGRSQIGPAPDAKFKEDLVTYMREMKDYPYLIGISYWCYNDYRSNYKGTPESGFREWGVVDENRKPKAAYQQLKEIYENWNK